MVIIRVFKQGFGSMWMSVETFWAGIGDSGAVARGSDSIRWVVCVRRLDCESTGNMAVLVGCVDGGAYVLLLLLTVRVRGVIRWKIVDVCAIDGLYRWWEVLPDLVAGLLVPWGWGDVGQSLYRGVGGGVEVRCGD